MLSQGRKKETCFVDNVTPVTKPQVGTFVVVVCGVFHSLSSHANDPRLVLLVRCRTSSFSSTRKPVHGCRGSGCSVAVVV